MGEKLGAVFGYERGSSNDISDVVGVSNIEISPLGESIGSDDGAEKSSSGGRSGREVAGKLEVSPLEGSSDGIPGG